MKKQTGPEGYYHMRKKQVKDKKVNPWEMITMLNGYLVGFMGCVQ
jgi:hypothetical protein